MVAARLSIVLIFLAALIAFQYAEHLKKKKMNEKLNRDVIGHRTHRRRFHLRGLSSNCHTICDVMQDQQPPQGHDDAADSDDDDYDDASDNETAIEATSLPPGYYNDIYLNNESGDSNDFRSDPDNPLVDFIVIKHRFSNETNQAFPPYAFAGRKARRGNRKASAKKRSYSNNKKRVAGAGVGAETKKKKVLFSG